MTAAWRCFVAIPVGPALRGVVTEALEGMRARHADMDGSWRWTSPAEWHVTLAFLGEAGPSEVVRATRAVAAAATSRPAFVLPTGDLGVFPSPRAARVLWYGVEDPDGYFAQIVADLRHALALEPASQHPHLTLARARHRHGAVADEILAEPAMPAGWLHVDRVRLYRSHRGVGPARYEVVAESPLGGGASRTGTAG